MTNRGPKLAVDCIILVDGKVLLIHRRNPPLGWALPGGFIEYGETIEDAVRREMKEETGLELEDLRQSLGKTRKTRNLRLGLGR
jgi:ADP-ribose pyrophosphatase YjhB (NUDIX family)